MESFIEGAELGDRAGVAKDNLNYELCRPPSLVPSSSSACCANASSVHRFKGSCPKPPKRHGTDVTDSMEGRAFLVGPHPATSPTIAGIAVINFHAAGEGLLSFSMRSPLSPEAPGQQDIISQPDSGGESAPVRSCSSPRRASLSGSLSSSPAPRSSVQLAPAPPPGYVHRATTPGSAQNMKQLQYQQQYHQQHHQEHQHQQLRWQNQQQQQPLQKQPTQQQAAGTATARTMVRQPSWGTALLRAFSAPLSRSTSPEQARTSGDWTQQAEGWSSADSWTGRTDPGDAAGSVVKPYGFLPAPAITPPLKPQWPTARLASSRHTAASAFTSFTAAPRSALRSSSGATAYTHPAADTSGSRPKQRLLPRTPPQRHFSNSRARSLVENLTFLNRGNTLNPPLNERINRIFQQVLPPPTAAMVMLQAVPSPMAPTTPPPPPPPVATAQLGLALQQLGREAVAQRTRAGSAQNGAESVSGAAVSERWAGNAPSMSSRSFPNSAAWVSRRDEWGDNAVTASTESGMVVGGDDGWVGCTPDFDTAALVPSQPGSLQLQGVSYRASKAACRALVDIRRPGINLRMRAMVDEE